MRRVSYQPMFYSTKFWLMRRKGSELLGGVTALLKVQAGIVGKYVADECQKLMGGYVSSIREIREKQDAEAN
jgi:hypothetical protein